MELRNILDSGKEEEASGKMSRFALMKNLNLRQIGFESWFYYLPAL